MHACAAVSMRSKSVACLLHEPGPGDTCVVGEPHMGQRSSRKASLALGDVSVTFWRRAPQLAPTSGRQLEELAPVVA